MKANLLASSSRNFASNSLLGGYFGKLEGSQATGSVVKNCMPRQKVNIPKFKINLEP